MSHKVFLHVGLPKSGTTYLQAVLDRNRAVLRDSGLLYPGRTWGEQVAAVRDLRGARVSSGEQPVEGAWSRLVGEIEAWPRDSVISMEWLAAATRAEVRHVVDDLAGTEPHVIITVRDIARTVPAAWQEFVQNRATWPWRDFVEQVASPIPERHPAGRSFWWQQDVEACLQRWSLLAPPERMHVITVPAAGQAPDELWQRFAAVVGVDPASADLSELGSNTSLGRESAELMRSVNARLKDLGVETHIYYRVFKHQLAKRVLAGRRELEDTVSLPMEYEGWARRCAERQVVAIEDSGAHVVGDLDDLLPQPRPQALRELDPEAVMDAAVDAVVALSLERYGPERHRPSPRAFETDDGRVASVLSVLEKECFLPTFLSHRSLLGAVREGGRLRHDDDVELSYLSGFSSFADVMLESRRVERSLRARGFDLDRQDAATLFVRSDGEPASSTALRVSAAVLARGRLHQQAAPTVSATRSDLLPTRAVAFEGQELPAPANPAAMLDATFGREWRSPAPTYAFLRPQRRESAFEKWFVETHERNRSRHWEHFYASSGHRVPTAASSFAQWVVKRETPGRLLDLGCGTGRDTRFFADQGFDVVGVDAVTEYAHALLTDVREHARPRLLRVDLDSLDHVLRIGSQLAHEGGPWTVYARFVWHALSDAARENAWRLVAMTLARGGRGYLEFRTPEDQSSPKFFGKHYRRYLAPEVVAAEAREHGLHVIEWDARRGWSPMGEEDPHLCRMILERRH